MKLDATIVLPANDFNQTQEQEAQLRTVFEDFDYLPMFGGKSFFGAWRNALDRHERKWLIFTHQDTRIYSVPPENELNALFEDNVGLAGIAGGRVLSPTEPWWFSMDRWRGGKLSGSAGHEVEGQRNITSYGPYGDVLCLDGVFLMTRADLIEKAGGIPETKHYAWDFYDHRFSMAFHHAGMRLITIPAMLFHFSTGANKRPEFLEEARRFSREFLANGAIEL